MFPRKILPKVHFLCVLALVQSQRYEYNSDEGDTESEIDGDSRPDYSKYYSVIPKDGGLSLAGFAQPQTGFNFGPFEAAFGASSQDKQKLIPTHAFSTVQSKPVEEPTAPFNDFFTRNLFAGNQPQDYFEQSQSRQRDEKPEEPSEVVSEEYEKEDDEPNQVNEETTEYNKPGPNYVSHEIPAKIPHQVETIKIPENGGFNYLTSHSKEAKQRDYKDHYKPLINQNYPPYINRESLIQQQHPQLIPQASGFQRLTKTSPLSPYQKYSFQPITKYPTEYLENLNSATNIIPNYGTTASRISDYPYQAKKPRISPRSANKKNCEKIKRNSGGGSVGDITCFVCQDEETNSKVTECSYQSEPDSTDLHRGSSQRYSVPAKKPDGFRFRRYASEDESDPYEYVKNRSLRAETEKQDDGDEYNYEGYSDSQPEKSYSEIQSDEILKDPKKCTDVERDGMLCRVCKDPSTGGNYESCSFSSAPKPEKYAYVSEKKYDSNDDPEYISEGNESKNVPTNAEVTSSEYKNKSRDEKKPHRKERKNGKKYSKNNEYKHLKGSKSSYSDYEYPENYDKRNTDENHSRSKGEKSKYHEQKYSKLEAESKHKPKVLKNQYDETADSENEENEDVSPYKNIEEYQFKYFPELSSGESRSKNEEEPLDYEASSRREVEDVLADFQKKNRSQCTETKKEGMTCFLCVDEKKVKNEECMFVSESRPKGTFTKYSKTDEIVSPSEKKPVTVHRKSVHQKFINVTKRPSVDTKSLDIAADASSEVETVVKPPSKRIYEKVLKGVEPKASASAVDSQRIEETDADPKINTPTEFQTPDEEGAFSAETKPVYSKTLRMTLPKYMLEKSEFEKEFDSFSSHQ